MKKYSLWVAAMVMTAIFVGGLTVTPVLAAKYTIKVVHLSNTDDEDYDGAMVFKDFCESQSNGEIAVEIYPGGQLCGNGSECLQAVQAGVIEVFQTTLGGFGQMMPELQVLDLPYMFPDDRVIEMVYDGPFGEEMRTAILEQTGMRLMCVGNTGGWRNIANTKKEIHTPADLKGLKLRTINSQIQIELVKALGASPTPIAWGELYTSLATGVVDGSKNGITDIVGMKFHEHIKYLTLDRHAYMASLWLINNDMFMSMPRNLRKIVDDGFYNLAQVTRAFPKRRQIAAYEEFKKAGGKIYVPTPEEKKQFVEAAKPVKEWYVKEYGRTWLDKLEKAIADTKAELEKKYKSELD